MGGKENYKQKEDVGEKQVLSTMKRIHGKRKHLGKQKKFEECNEAG